MVRPCNHRSTTGLDVIGDVHGCALKLKELLERLGYQLDPTGRAYGHADRRAVFVGDLVDRGTQQLEVLQLVEAMVDHGSADICMGNHEFNAIAYATEDPEEPGAYLRRHSEKNGKQHHAFLSQLNADQRNHYVEWFETLPLWLDFGGLRVVHACWHDQSMRVVEDACGTNRLSRELVDALLALR